MLTGVVFAWLVSLVVGEGEVHSKYVTTDLDAVWAQTPFHMEAAEFLHEGSSDLFWDFIDYSCRSPDDDILIESGTDRLRYEAVVSLVVDHQLLSPLQTGLLRWALALRMYSPRVQAQQSAARAVLAELAATPVANCSAFAVVWPTDGSGGPAQALCDPQLLEHVLLGSGGGGWSVRTQPHVFAGEHKYSGGDGSTHTAIVYGSVGERHFCRLHATAAKLSSTSSLNYIVRHFWQNGAPTRVRLSGYSVELAIKSTEYKAQDDTKVEEDGSGSIYGDDDLGEVEGFIFSKLNKIHSELLSELRSFQRHLVVTSAQFAPLKVWQLQHLSLQAATRVIRAADPDTLQQLAHISQNFPSLARSLIRTRVESNLTTSVKRVADKLKDTVGLQIGQAMLFVNGMMIDPLSADVFSLLETLRSEMTVLNGLMDIGVNHSMFETLMKLYADESQTEGFAVDFRDSAVHWLNDVARDKVYSRYPSSLRELLRPSFGGMMRVIRRNMYHVVAVLDPMSVAETLQILTSLQTLYDERIPMTMGVVWSVGHNHHNDVINVTGLTDARLAIIEAFNYVVALSQSVSSPSFKAVKFIIDVLKKVSSDQSLSAKLIHESLTSQYTSLSVDDVFGAESEYDTGKLLAPQFVKRLGINSLPQVLFNGVPLSSSRISGGNLEEALLQEMIGEVQKFMAAVMGGELNDDDDVAEWITSQPHFMPRLNQRILSESSLFLELTGRANNTDLDHVTSGDLLSAAGRSQLTAILRAHLRYVTRPSEGVRVRPITLWVVADLDNAEGRQLLHDALTHTKSSHLFRCAFVANAGSAASDGAASLNARALAATAVLPPAKLLPYLLRLSEPRAQHQLADWADQLLPEWSRDRLTSLLSDSVLEKLLRVHIVHLGRVLNVPAGSRALVVNGRLLGPLGPAEQFGPDDLDLLERFVMATGVVERTRTLLVKHASETDSDGKDLSDMLMETNALLSSRNLKKNRYSLPDLSGYESVIVLPPFDPSLTVFNIVAICDPVSREAQHLATLLSVLRQVINARIQVVLNPKLKHSDMPLSSYYRLVLEAEPQFSRDERQHVVGPVARFTGIPDSPILTQHYHVPDNWIIAADRSLHDLDNIRLGTTEFGVHSDFLLESLLVEGHCFEQASGSPPRGLQLTLEPYGGTLSAEMVDTIVMANLGYFQLKANPGPWILQLREGRSRELYDLLSLDGAAVTQSSASGHVAGAPVLIDSFSSRVVKLRVAKKPERSSEELIEAADGDADSGIWNSIKNTFSSSEGGASGAEDVLNIFSLASGHLYERLMRIMILSVLKHTRTPVKFWFLKNYLSPSFKDLLGPMSKQYGFNYELVQYNWPRWLHQQTDKQRIIWGYKILFLDVLFPLNVKKIIFVDADQIVRTDLKELRDLDLEGAPYGYTPFCDSRKEMDGFRFWNQGYWRQHLQGRKYHISALYVVDLQKFRQVAAGDRLRGQYQGLSQDPNSLSNLDQDLPNNMIHQVRIKSLPQEWLWCETWCDDDSKRNAKTIDLCNNPMTKEAKLDAAARIVPEWTEYDATIRNFINSLKNSTVSSRSHGIGVHSEL